MRPSPNPAVQAPIHRVGTGSPGTTDGAALPLWRLHLLRAGYLILGGGLAVVKWPRLIHPDPATSLMHGVVDAMLGAVGALLLLGLRYPVRMLPILLYELLWKVVWLGAVALPAWFSGRLDAATAEVISDFTWVVIVVVIVPWRYALSQYVLGPVAPWRHRPLD